MSFPNIKYYALLEDTTGTRKTPKFTIAKAVGYYPQMNKLIGRNGKISFDFVEKLKEGLTVPACRLQAKNSLNFTGLKDLFVNGKITGFAYGYPLSTETYSSKNKPNPFYSCRNDGYLFRVYTDEKGTKPTKIELIVLEDAKQLIATYCKMLEQGGFNEALELLRKQAQNTI